MDEIDVKLAELLFTKVGMIMEDAVAGVLNARVTRTAEMDAQIALVRRDAERISALALALTVLQI